MQNSARNIEKWRIKSLRHTSHVVLYHLPDHIAAETRLERRKSEKIIKNYGGICSPFQLQEKDNKQEISKIKNDRHVIA